jgi:hypothetical protein
MDFQGWALHVSIINKCRSMAGLGSGINSESLLKSSLSKIRAGISL